MEGCAQPKTHQNENGLVGSLDHFAFSRPGKKQIGSLPFAFSRPGKKQIGCLSHFAFSRPGNKQIGSLNQPFCFFPAREQANWKIGSLSLLLFPGFCFFQAGEKANWKSEPFAFSRPGKKQTAQTFILLFPGRGKSKLGSLIQFCFFPAREKEKFQASNLLFPGPGKSKMVRLPFCFFPAGSK